MQTLLGSTTLVILVSHVQLNVIVIFCSQMSASLTSEFICWDAAPRNKGQSMRDGESKSWHLGSKVYFYVELAGLSIRGNYHEQSSG